jgi:hypothetical protein
MRGFDWMNKAGMCDPDIRKQTQPSKRSIVAPISPQSLRAYKSQGREISGVKTKIREVCHAPA